MNLQVEALKSKVQEKTQLYTELRRAETSSEAEPDGKLMLRAGDYLDKGEWEQARMVYGELRRAARARRGTHKVSN